MPPVSVILFGIALALAVGLAARAFRRLFDEPAPELSREQVMGVVTRVLRERDPDFDPEAFVARACRAFLLVRGASDATDLARLRPLVSDGMFERLRLGHEGRVALRETAHRDLVLLGAELAYIHSRDHFDELTVGIRARAAAPGEPGASVPAGAFCTFLRRRGGKTRAAPGLLERRCPNCGAEIEALDRPICAACRSRLHSGEHDWVLVKMTAPEGWRPPRSSCGPGLARCAEADPHFSVQHLEDHAALVYWRLRWAMRERDAHPLASVSAASFVERWCPPRGETAAARILSVDALGLLDDPEWQRALVSVSWLHADARPGALPATTLLVLGRRAGTVSTPERELSSAHCAGCGAPDLGDGGADCGFCGRPLNDGDSWVLLDAAEAGSSGWRQWLGRLERARRPGRALPDVDRLHASEGALAWGAALLSRDGGPTPAEAAALARLATRAGVQGDPLARAGAPPAPPDARTARHWLTTAIDLALVEPGIAGARRALLEELAAHGELLPFDLELRIDRRERQLDGRESEQRTREEIEKRHREHVAWRALVTRDHGR